METSEVVKIKNLGSMKHPLNRMKWQMIEAGRKYLQIIHRTEMCKETSKCNSIIFQPPDVYASQKKMDCAVKGSLSKSGMFGTYTFQIMVWPLQAPGRKHVSSYKVLPDECACLAGWSLLYFRLTMSFMVGALSHEVSHLQEVNFVESCESF